MLLPPLSPQHCVPLDHLLPVRYSEIVAGIEELLVDVRAAASPPQGVALRRSVSRIRAITFDILDIGQATPDGAAVFTGPPGSGFNAGYDSDDSRHSAGGQSGHSDDSVTGVATPRVATAGAGSARQRLPGAARQDRGVHAAIAHPTTRHCGPLPTRLAFTCDCTYGRFGLGCCLDDAVLGRYFRAERRTASREADTQREPVCVPRVHHARSCSDTALLWWAQNNLQRKRCYRHCAHELGYKWRRRLPECVVAAVRSTWPDSSGDYMGYHQS